MPKSKPRIEKQDKSKIHEPLSSYYPPPFTVEHPDMQITEPEYYGHGAVYVKKEEHRQKTKTQE